DLLKLAKDAEQREVERRAHRLRSEAPGERGVLLELPPIALELPADEVIEATAFVRAGLEIDDPARAAAVDERAIDHDIGEPAARHPRERELTARLAVLAGENPTPSFILDGPGQRFDDICRCSREIALRYAVAPQLLAIKSGPRLDPRARRQLRGGCELLQCCMHDSA